MNVKAILAAAALASASFAATAGEIVDIPSHALGQSQVSVETRLIWADNESGYQIRVDSGLTRQADSAPAIDTEGLYIA